MPFRKRVILAHDKPEKRKQFSALLENAGFHVATAACGREAVDLAAKDECGVAVLDCLMPFVPGGRPEDDGGLDAMEQIHAAHPILPIILFSRNELDHRLQERMTRCRIFDYLVRDEENFEFKLLRRVTNAVEVYLSRRARTSALPNFVFQSAVMKQVMLHAAKAAEHDLPVVILGETGVGKSLLADVIHARSQRAGQPLLELNCASLTEGLVESELFGHVKGAFTGAVADKRGVIERAGAGTLFLDEIGDMSLGTQAKLLTVLEKGVFTPVGGEREETAEARILCATNRDLQKMAEDGRFREDLFYRLRYESIVVPPLRERLEDLPPLVELFVDQFRRQYNRQIAIREDVLEFLRKQPLRGNVRELRSLIKSALFRMEPMETELTPYHFHAQTDTIRQTAGLLPADDVVAQAVGRGVDLETLVESFHFKLIDEALRQARDNAADAARLLGMNPHTLRRHLRQREGKE